MNSAKYFDYIEGNLNLLASRLETRASLNLLNLHNHAENFYKRFLNILFGWNLINANGLVQNMAGIDLVDEQRNILISVSGTATKDKIVSGMKKDLSKYRGYQFKFIAISKSAESLKSMVYSENPHGLVFNPAEDIYDVKTLLNKIHYCENDSVLQDLYQLFSQEFSNIEFVHQTDMTPFDPVVYAKKALDNYHHGESQYTMLLAEHRELDTYLDLLDECDESTSSKSVRVVDIPLEKNMCYLLGESGAGKTTSLWKIFIDRCNAVLDGQTKKAPVFINIRRWKKSVDILDFFKEALLSEHLSDNVIIKALREGLFIILIDGINEIETQQAQQCYRDIAHFIAKYANNQYVIACRSADFQQQMISAGDLNPIFLKPDVFEIARLSERQITEYSNNYFHQYGLTSEDFFNRISLHDESAWFSTTSTLQLARIPLFLQIFLETYRKTKYLPNSKAKLLGALIHIIYEREAIKSQHEVGETLLEKALSQLSYALQWDGYALRIPISPMKDKLMPILGNLKSEGVAAQGLQFDHFWNWLLSANFFKQLSSITVEWLHQLVRDYFIGIEIARICRLSNGEDSGLRVFCGARWDMAMTVALEFLGGTLPGAKLLRLQIDSVDVGRGYNTTRIFEGLSSSTRYDLALGLIKSILDEGDFESKTLEAISTLLPFCEVAEAMNDSFYHARDEEMVACLMNAMSNMIIVHLPKVANDQDFYMGYFSHDIRKEDYKKAIRRCQELLYKYLRGTNEIASFYASKGLWESDRTAAVDRLQQLHQTSNPRVKALVVELIEEWGID